MHKNLLKKKLKFATLFTALLGSISGLNAQQNALNFDGTNDYIQTNFPGILGNTARTVEAWIKLPTTTAGENLIVDWGSDNVNGGRFTVRINNVSGSYKLRIENKGGGINGNITLNDGNWHHIAVTYDNALLGNRYKLYVDGNLDVQGDISTLTNTVALTNMIIGRRLVASYGGFFNGSIDEVRIWDKALTPAEIQTNKNAEFCTAPTNLKAYFKINEGTVNSNNSTVTSITSSAGSYTGTLNSFALNGTTSNFTAGASALTTVNINTAVTVSGATLTASQAGATYQWINCNNGNAPVGVTTQSFTPTVAGNYAVIVTLSGCSQTSSCQSVTLGVHDVDAIPELTLSPNPTSGILKITAKNEIEKVEITNVAGQKLMNFQPNSANTELNISQLTNGVYLVKVTSKQQSQVYKIIKK
ncbi:MULTISPECIES: LamG-like jellyroll fold domain-containing protein [Chryseobacterium]|uniref:LamG-like jellyroll fold domain-containing protein n=1 Tax=Chryseobacterium TaxID=59732 RepID=UPI000C9DFD52|nr:MULTISPECIES: LamG-like jellyroll fold domain-containing protein [Chryseobacterium]VXC62724.1 Por secretion system C-terminal sorting domain-containing protein [Chryseobacterium sp. 8AT]